MKKYFLGVVFVLILGCFAGCGTATKPVSKSYENETLGFAFEIPHVWEDNYVVNEYTQDGITYTDFNYVYGWQKNKTALLVSVIATDEETWTSRQLENEYYLMAINKEGVYFANRVPLVPEEVPFKENSKKAKKFISLLLSLQEADGMFSLTK